MSHTEEAEDGSTVRVVEIYDKTYESVINVGPDIDVLRYADGSMALRHIHDRPRRGWRIVVAPLFDNRPQYLGHVVITEDPLTVTPSFLCYDCGLHGHIVEGVWKSV